MKQPDYPEEDKTFIEFIDSKPVRPRTGSYIPLDTPSINVRTLRVR
jgi:hypothetical protein